MKTVGKNSEVGAAWVNGHPMRSHNGNYRTDGTHLWSYDLMIGKRDAEGKPILLNVMSLISPRTSDHVREAIEPQVKLVVPAVDPDNLSAYTRYSFPENPEEDTENLWGREKEPITFIPTRIRTEFPPDDYIEINDPVYFKKLKLPKDSMSAYISDVDTNEYHERLGLRNFCEFWISSDCWNYVAALEDRVLFMEYTEAKSTERIVYAYFLITTMRLNFVLVFRFTADTAICLKVLGSCNIVADCAKVNGRKW
jgi:hypothetical protein